MVKQIILYNLADHVTDEEYMEYVAKEKGPLLESLSSVKKFELVRVNGSTSVENPYQYVGIMHMTNLEEFSQKDAPSQAFLEFMDKWQSMVQNVTMLAGDEIY